MGFMEIEIWGSDGGRFTKGIWLCRSTVPTPA